MFKGPFTSLDEDYKQLGLKPLSEGKKVEKKSKKVLKEKGKKSAKLGIGKAPKKESRDTDLSRFLSAAREFNGDNRQSASTLGAVVSKGSALVSGMDRISNLVEDVQGILSDLNAEADTDIVQGFSDIAYIYKTLGRKFKALGESQGSRELMGIGRYLSERAVVADRIAKKLETHLSEGRGPQIDYARVEAKFREHAQMACEGLELMQELDAMMKGNDDDELDGHDDDHEGDHEDGHEGDDDHEMGHERGHDVDDGAPVKKHRHELGHEGGEGDEDDGMESGEEDEMAMSGMGDEEVGDADGDMDHDGDNDGDDDGDGDDDDDDDDDFLSHMHKRDKKGADHESDEDDESVEGDEAYESDESDEDDKDDKDDEDDEDDEDVEDVEEDVVDTSAESAKLLGKKVSQRDEDDEAENGEIATDNDSGHGGSSADAIRVKGDGVMKKGKVESRNFKGQSKKGKARR